jgi:predicted O-methyltransferase YrrM
LLAEELHPFDLIFIDADKPSNAAYLDWAMRLSRPGTVIVVDNVIRNGEVTDPLSGNASVRGSRDAFDNMGSNAHLSATALQTVGVKGYDGFAIGIVD